jgi:hypothetical protein
LVYLFFVSHIRTKEDAVAIFFDQFEGFFATFFCLEVMDADEAALLLNITAVAWPIPLLEPVTKTFLPLRSS